ncbi:MAG TPA: AAA family ATPase [Xanthobacteraceae bacterium]|nr:AAA family ATPase [Xanthobacteraceae bacterium]
MRRIVSSARIEGPRFWIVAGPNGSGKSSLYDQTNIESFGRSVWIINPDLLAARIRSVESLEPDAANLEAVRRIEAWLDASIQAHQTVGVETVLSTPKYRRLVSAAKSRKFEINLIYLLLQSPALCVERVRLRVAKGGHDVPTQKIIDRWQRSLDQLPWYLEQADRAWLFDNSGATPRVMGQKEKGTIFLDPDALPEIKKVAALIRTG